MWNKVPHISKINNEKDRSSLSVTTRSMAAVLGSNRSELDRVTVEIREHTCHSISRAYICWL